MSLYFEAVWTPCQAVNVCWRAMKHDPLEADVYMAHGSRALLPQQDRNVFPALCIAVGSTEHR